MGKKIAGVGLVLVLLIVGVVYYLATNLNPLVKSAIEKYGSEITGVPVKVADVSLSLKSGEGTIKGLTIGNPPGFKGKPAFELGEVTVGIDIASLGKQPIVIDKILIESPKVNLVANAGGETNIDIIAKNAKSYGGGGKTSESAPAEPAEPDAGGSEPLIRITSFTFDDGALSADLSQAGGKDYQTTLPTLHLNNLGGSTGGTPAQIGQEMTTAVTDAVTLRVAEAGADALIDRHLEGGAADAAKGAVREFMKLKGK